MPQAQGCPIEIGYSDPAAGEGLGRSQAPGLESAHESNLPGSEVAPPAPQRSASRIVLPRFCSPTVLHSLSPPKESIASAVQRCGRPPCMQLCILGGHTTCPSCSAWIVRARVLSWALHPSISLPTPAKLPGAPVRFVTPAF